MRKKNSLEIKNNYDKESKNYSKQSLISANTFINNNANSIILKNNFSNLRKTKLSICKNDIKDKNHKNSYSLDEHKNLDLLVKRKPTKLSSDYYESDFIERDLLISNKANQKQTFLKNDMIKLNNNGSNIIRCSNNNIKNKGSIIIKAKSNSIIFNNTGNYIFKKNEKLLHSNDKIFISNINQKNILKESKNTNEEKQNLINKDNFCNNTLIQESKSNIDLKLSNDKDNYKDKDMNKKEVKETINRIIKEPTKTNKLKDRLEAIKNLQLKLQKQKSDKSSSFLNLTKSSKNSKEKYLNYNSSINSIKQSMSKSIKQDIRKSQDYKQDGNQEINMNNEKISESEMQTKFSLANCKMSSMVKNIQDKKVESTFNKNYKICFQKNNFIKKSNNSGVFTKLSKHSNSSANEYINSLIKPISNNSVSIKNENEKYKDGKENDIINKEKSNTNTNEFNPFVKDFINKFNCIKILNPSQSITDIKNKPLMKTISPTNSKENQSSYNDYYKNYINLCKINLKLQEDDDIEDLELKNNKDKISIPINNNNYNKNNLGLCRYDRNKEKGKNEDSKICNLNDNIDSTLNFNKCNIEEKEDRCYKNEAFKDKCSKQKMVEIKEMYKNQVKNKIIRSLFVKPFLDDDCTNINNNGVISDEAVTNNVKKEIAENSEITQTKFTNTRAKNKNARKIKKSTISSLLGTHKFNLYNEDLETFFKELNNADLQSNNQDINYIISQFTNSDMNSENLKLNIANFTSNFSNMSYISNLTKLNKAECISQNEYSKNQLNVNSFGANKIYNEDFPTDEEPNTFRFKSLKEEFKNTNFMKENVLTKHKKMSLAEMKKKYSELKKNCRKKDLNYNSLFDNNINLNNPFKKSQVLNKNIGKRGPSNSIGENILNLNNKFSLNSYLLKDKKTSKNCNSEFNNHNNKDKGKHIDNHNIKINLDSKITYKDIKNITIKDITKGNVVSYECESSSLNTDCNLKKKIHDSTNNNDNINFNNFIKSDDNNENSINVNDNLRSLKPFTDNSSKIEEILKNLNYDNYDYDNRCDNRDKIKGKEDNIKIIEENVINNNTYCIDLPTKSKSKEMQSKSKRYINIFDYYEKSIDMNDSTEDDIYSICKKLNLNEFSKFNFEYYDDSSHVYKNFIEKFNKPEESNSEIKNNETFYCSKNNFYKNVSNNYSTEIK